MLIFMNAASVIVVFLVAAYGGWLGEALQFRLTKAIDVNEKYDREVLLALALVQAGKGNAIFNDSGFIEIETENTQYLIYGTDYCNEKFGDCYSRRVNYGYWQTDHADGCLSLSTRRYLKQFKEEYMGIMDPSSKTKTQLFKKEKVTLE